MYNLINYYFKPTTQDLNVIKLKFDKSGKIKSFTSDLSISTSTTSYTTGTTLIFLIIRGTNQIYLDNSALFFSANNQSQKKTTLVDISVQEGDLFYVAGNGTSGTLNGTVTVNFI